MEKKRRLIVDTDTGSDDVWAIIEALRATDLVQVEAVTVLCGNFPLDLCVKNAMLAVEAAGTCLPPVYRGMERPLLGQPIFSAEDVHGADGLGGMHLPASMRPVEKKHAVEAIIELVMEAPGEIEIVTCGPLTNLAMAILREPAVAKKLKKAWILGGTAGAEGNLTPAAEYNVGTDPEAAAIVLSSGVDSIWVTWDNARGETEITPEDVRKLLSCGTEAARFCALCTRDLARYCQREYGGDTFGVIDSMVMTAALFPEIVAASFPAYCAVDVSEGPDRGHFRIDRSGTAGREPNAVVVTRVNADQYKRHLFRLLGVSDGEGYREIV